MKETAIFAAGCFWHIEEVFSKLSGIISTKVGYVGGKTENPTYEQVCSGKTGHAEAIEIIFNSDTFLNPSNPFVFNHSLFSSI